MEARSAHSAIVLVEHLDPGVQLLNFLQHVIVISRRWAICRKPDKLGRVQNGGNDHLVLGMRVEGVLQPHFLLHVDKPFHNSSVVGSPEQIIKPS